MTDIGPGGSAATPPAPVASYQPFDFSVGYDFARGSTNPLLSKLSVRVGVNNAFNKMPLLAPSAFPDSNIDLGTYNLIGRLYFVDASYKF